MTLARAYVIVAAIALAVIVGRAVWLVVRRWVQVREPAAMWRGAPKWENSRL